MLVLNKIDQISVWIWLFVTQKRSVTLPVLYLMLVLSLGCSSRLGGAPLFFFLV